MNGQRSSSIDRLRATGEPSTICAIAIIQLLRSNYVEESLLRGMDGVATTAVLLAAHASSSLWRASASRLSAPVALTGTACAAGEPKFPTNAEMLILCSIYEQHIPERLAKRERSYRFSRDVRSAPESKIEGRCAKIQRPAGNF